MQDIACVAITLSVSVMIMSKGSSPRPFSVSNQEYQNRWDAIFGKDNEKKDEEKSVESDRPADPCDSGSSDNSEGQTGQVKNS